MSFKAQQVGAFARAVVAKRVLVLSTIGLVLGVLVQNRVLSIGLETQVTHWAEVTLSVIGILSGTIWAQRGATPADPALQPKDKFGNDLVSALTVGPHAGIDPVAPDLPVGDPLDVDGALAAAAAIHPMGDNSATS